MKTFFTILGICIVGILANPTYVEKPRDQEGIDACIKEVGIDPDVADKTIKGKLDKNDEKQGCFAACLLKKMGAMNADGSINENKISVPDGVDKERASMMRNKCRAMKGANDCKNTLKVISCMQEVDNLLQKK